MSISTISTSGTISQSGATITFTPTVGSPSTLDFTAGVTINTGASVKLTTDLSFSTVNQYFIIGSDSVTFDGSGNKIVINNTPNYPGLIKCAVTAYIATIKNLGVTVNTVSSTSVLLAGGGWVVQGYSTSGILDSGITCTSCYSDGVISTTSSGGIFGKFSSGTANYCYSTGTISGGTSGGIFGYNLNGTISGNTYIKANYCYSIGNISSSTAGGIFCGSGIANYCYSTGTITGAGICYSAYTIGTNNIANYCYSTGKNNSGGIFRGSGTATNCYSTGEIGINSGGIYAGNASNSTVQFCYSTGTITGGGNGGGGIFSPNSNGNTINYCYSTGAIGTSSNVGGGIMAAGSGVSGNSINYCYSTGISIVSNSGGIIASSAVGVNSINYCYSIGATVMANTSSTLTNCIASSSGVWYDTSANSTIGATGLTNWEYGYTATSSPWLLSSYNGAIYDPSFVTLNDSAITYNSTVGLFTSTNVFYGSTAGSAIVSPNYTLLSVSIPKYTPTINTTTGVLTFTHPEGSIVCKLLSYYTFNSTYVSYNFNYFTLSAPIPCFLLDTKIKVSPTQYKFIQDLKEGDLVYTSDGREVPILKISQYSVLPNPLSYPYVIPKGYRYGEFVCEEDLYLSPEHGVLIDPENIVPVKALGFHQDTTLTHFTYFHLTLPNFFTDHIVANGIPCESYAGESALQSQGNYICMYFNHEIFKRVYDKQHFIRKNLTYEKYNRIVDSTTINLPIQLKALPTYEVIPESVDFNFFDEI